MKEEEEDRGNVRWGSYVSETENNHKKIKLWRKIQEVLVYTTGLEAKIEEHVNILLMVGR